MRVEIKVVSLMGSILLLIPSAGALGANATTQPAVRAKQGVTTRPGAMTGSPGMGMGRPAVSPPASAPDPDSVAVIVNGQPVKERAVDEVLSRGKPASPVQLAQMRQTYKAQMARVMEIVIDNELLEQAAKKAGVTVTDKELADEVDSMVKRNIEMTGLSAEDFAKKVERRMGKSMKDLMAEAAADPARRRLDLLRKLSRREFPNDVKVTDDEIKEYYDKNLEQRFKQPERVRASHILLGTRDPKTRQPMSEEAKKEQRKKAEEVLAKLKKPGADFAALAKEYSTDPGSKDDGGDLGFFSREVMVPEFSEAAFKTKVGQMTDIVETQHGYHIIKVTGHKDAETEPLDKVKSEIRDELEREKIVKKMPEYREELRKPAKIEYPPGKKPASLPATPPPMSRPAMGLPSGHPPVQGATTRPARTIRVLPQGNPQSNPPKANPAK